MAHIPVLLKEVLDFLEPSLGEFFIDCTLGDGGHAKEILKKIGADGKLLALDWDKKNISRFPKEKNVSLLSTNYAELEKILKGKKADGLLADLGFSTTQIEESGRGFSFLKDEPLLMTYSDESESVQDILKEISEEELADIIYQYGGERYSRRIAKAIKEEERKEKITTSGKLAEIIRKALPRNYERGRIDRATRTFQALRIYANRELDNLERLLASLPKIMKSGGRAGIITFHSLEDGLVKRSFKKFKEEGLADLINKKPISASLEEKRENPKSRSAKLRIIKFK